MHIRHLIFASLSFISAGIAYCIETLLSPAFDSWPAYQPTSATESIALDRVQATIEASDSPLERFLAFAKRALLHDRYSAGRFDCGSAQPAS